MLQNRFSENLLESIVELLWRQWAALGGSGHAAKWERGVIDPDALLVATCHWGRYEPRLFDEMLEWLEANGWCINIQRVRTWIRLHDYGSKQVLAAVASLQVKGAVTAKWQKLSEITQPIKADAPLESLFFLPDGRAQPQFGPAEPSFARIGFHRGSIELRGQSQTFDPVKPTSLLCRLRALFGVNARADILLYLLTRREGHPPVMARLIGYFPKTVQTTLAEMANSGLVRMLRKGREKHYWVEPKEWGGLLAGERGQSYWPEWRAWPQFFAAMAEIWKMAQSRALATKSAELQAAEWLNLLEKLHPLLVDSGLVFSLPPGESSRGANCLEAIQERVVALVK